jgi:hypothetical protein
MITDLPFGWKDSNDREAAKVAVAGPVRRVARLIRVLDKPHRLIPEPDHG